MNFIKYELNIKLNGKIVINMLLQFTTAINIFSPISNNLIKRVFDIIMRICHKEINREFSYNCM